MEPRRIGLRHSGPEGKPENGPEEVVLSFDEAEALRLADLVGLYQEAAARSMGVSRQTFARIVEAARRKSADAILNGKTLRVGGGEIRIIGQGERIMKIAVPSQDGMVDAHFGHCREFLVFTAQGKTLVPQAAIPSLQGCGCKSGIAAELARSGVTHLVAGNMGDGAVRVLGAQGIKVIRGASGDAARAAQALLDGTLADSGAGCAEHGGAGHECSH